MAKVGMNPDVVKAQARVLEEQADQIKRVSHRIDGLIGDLKAAWEGPDSDRFANRWHSDYKAQLSQAEKMLREKGQSATAQAKQQMQTSQQL